MVHSQRREDATLEELVERLAGHDFNQQAEQVGAEVGVDVAGARACFERAVDDRGARFERAPGDAPDVAAGGQAGRMREELADSDLVLLAAIEGREVGHDTLVEVDLLFVEQDHHRGGGANDFGEGGDVVDRLLRIDRRAARQPGQLAKALFHHGGAISTYDDGGARVSPGLYAAINYALDCLEADGRHADVHSWLDGKTVAGSGNRECRKNDPEQL